MARHSRLISVCYGCLQALRTAAPFFVRRPESSGASFIHQLTRRPLMFDSVVLDVALGLIFIYLFSSLTFAGSTKS